MRYIKPAIVTLASVITLACGSAADEVTYTNSGTGKLQTAQVAYQPSNQRASRKPVKTDRAADISEFLRAQPPRYRNIPPPDFAKMLRKDSVGIDINDPVMAVDLNGDGKYEIVVTEACGSGGCIFSTYEQTQSGYRKILDDGIGTVGGTTNGWINLFKSHLTFIDTSATNNDKVEVVVKYVHDGVEYAEASRFIAPDNKKPVARYAQDMFREEKAPEKIRQWFFELGTTFDGHDALDILLASQLGPDIPFPTDVAYEGFLEQLYNDRGIDYRGLSREEAKRRLFSNITNSIVLDPTSPRTYAFVAGKGIADSLAESLGLDTGSQYMQTLRKVDTRVADLESRLGRRLNPKNPEDRQMLADSFELGASLSVREDQLAPIQAPQQSIGRSYTTPEGTTVTSEDIYPSATIQELRQLRQRQEQAGREMQARENWQRATEDFNQSLQRMHKGAEELGQSIGRLFAPRR